MRINLRASEMTADEQLEEIARIFAAGAVRLRKLRRLGVENLSESDRNPLDVPAETRLSVTTG